MKLKELTENAFWTDHREISKWLRDMGIHDYEISDKGVVDVVGNVELSDRFLREIPIQFGHVEGNFLVQRNRLKSLKGCPTSVSRSFYCSENFLTSVDFAPTHIGGSASFAKNSIRSLKGIADIIKSIDGTLFFDLEEVKSHCLGVLHIEKLRRIFIPAKASMSVDTTPFTIINKYIGRPDDIFDCQAELIEHGYEAFAQL